MKFLKIICVLYIATVSLRCATTTSSGAVGLDRKQLLLVSSEELESKSVEAYEHVKAESKKNHSLDRDFNLVQRLQGISKKIIPQTTFFRSDSSTWKWEVHLQTSEELNAYCMPGGKIMFYTGIIEKLHLTDGEIAAIMGHEIAHALREHGREQMSEQLLKMGLLRLGVETGIVKENYAQALTVFSDLVIGLPHSRNQESEADLVGLELMARSGFDPREAITLWTKMSTQGGGKPPEFLSTHPSDNSRIQNIRNTLPKVMPLYQQVR